MNSKDLDENKTSKVEEIYPGYYEFEYAGLFLKVNPLLAGDITALKYNGKDILVPRDSSLTTYGATLWISPQKLWDVWPPPYALNQAPYDATLNNGKLSMESDVDGKTGLQVTKEITLGKYDSAVNLVYHITNQRDDSVKVAPWEITRLFKGGMVFFPGKRLMPATLKSASRDIPVSNYWLSRVESKNHFKSLTKDDFYYWLSMTEEESDLERVVADGQFGWSAYVKDRILFLKKFPDVPDGAVPQSHGEIEVNNNTGYNYFELEQQGTYRQLAPGASIEWPVKWYVREIPENIPVKRHSRQLIQYVEKIINNPS